MFENFISVFYAGDIVRLRTISEMSPTSSIIHSQIVWLNDAGPEALFRVTDVKREMHYPQLGDLIYFEPIRVSPGSQMSRTVIGNGYRERFIIAKLQRGSNRGLVFDA